MIVECAWCGCVVGEKDGRGLSGITSGICDECFEAIAAELPLAEGSRAPEPERELVREAPRARRAGSAR